jgi:XTP/dITP diphosphohydrolase
MVIKMKEILIATQNKHKIMEMKQLLEPLGFEVLTLHNFPKVPEIIEDQDTFRGNAFKKAKTLSDILQKDVIADDSGLEVYALDMAPGVYSARYAGENVTDEDNNQLLLKNMKDIQNRKARFVTTICYYRRHQEPVYFEDYLMGEIARTYQGENGFGYDPIFIVDADQRHLAEYTMEEKNKISHRGKCTQKLVQFMKNNK